MKRFADGAIAGTVMLLAGSVAFVSIVEWFI